MLAVAQQQARSAATSALTCCLLAVLLLACTVCAAARCSLLPCLCALPCPRYFCLFAAGAFCCCSSAKPLGKQPQMPLLLMLL